MGELLANDTYREELRTAFNTVGNRQPAPQNRQIEPPQTNNPFRNLVGSISTTALTMTVRIGTHREDAIPDSGAAVSVITRARAQELGLTISNNLDINLTAYGNPLGVVGVVKDAPLQIQSAKIPIDLQVVDAAEGSILLSMDWFSKYRV